MFTVLAFSNACTELHPWRVGAPGCGVDGRRGRGDAHAATAAGDAILAEANVVELDVAQIFHPKEQLEKKELLIEV